MARPYSQLTTAAKLQIAIMYQKKESLRSIAAEVKASKSAVERWLQSEEYLNYSGTSQGVVAPRQKAGTAGTEVDQKAGTIAPRPTRVGTAPISTGSDIYPPPGSLVDQAHNMVNGLYSMAMSGINGALDRELDGKARANDAFCAWNSVSRWVQLAKEIREATAGMPTTDLNEGEQWSIKMHTAREQARKEADAHVE